MLDVIVKKDINRETMVTLRLALERVKDTKIIRADNYKDACAQSTAEYICFMGKGIVSGDYFSENLGIFHDNPLFAKLAMVSPTVTDRQLKNRIYGYRLTPLGVFPVTKPSSIMPYGVQIGYLPGAIIKRYLLERNAKYLKDSALLDSYQVSSDSWMGGSYCYINPRTTYVDTENNPNQSLNFVQDPWEHSEKMSIVKVTWRREIIG